MTYAGGERRFDGSTSLPVGGREEFWTYEAVVERLIEALRLWRRSPGGGTWPFAKDAPWQLMTRAARLDAGRVKGMDLNRLLQEDDERETRDRLGREPRRALSRDEVARRDEASEWLSWVPAGDRRLVILVLTQLMAGRTNIDWTLVKRQIGAEIGNKGIYRRYSRAIQGVCERLNRASVKTIAR